MGEPASWALASAIGGRDGKAIIAKYIKSVCNTDAKKEETQAHADSDVATSAALESTKCSVGVGNPMPAHIIHTHIHTSKQTNKQTSKHTHKHTYVHACAHTCIHTHINTCMHTCIHTYILTYTHTYTHILTHMHAYIYTYMHTCIHACMLTYIRLAYNTSHHIT